MFIEHGIQSGICDTGGFCQLVIGPVPFFAQFLDSLQRLKFFHNNFPSMVSKLDFEIMALSFIIAQMDLIG